MNQLLIALITLAVQIGQTALTGEQPRASIEGMVVKLGTGEPLSNASVQLNLEDSPVEARTGDPLPRADFHRTAKSDRSGRFVFENISPGKYRLISTYEAGGY